MDGETGNTEWLGYAKHNTVIYDSFYLQGDVMKKPGYNTEVAVLKELNNCYFISVNGLEGYVAKEIINGEKNPISYGGNSDSGSSSGSSSGGNSYSEWSPPML